MEPKRVIRVVFESPPAADEPRKPERIRLAVLVLYPMEVKRQLATVDNAKARAVQLARQIILAQLVDPPDLDALPCSAEVIEYDLGPLWDVRQKLADGTHVWLSEVERPVDFSNWR